MVYNYLEFIQRRDNEQYNVGVKVCMRLFLSLLSNQSFYRQIDGVQDVRG